MSTSKWLDRKYNLYGKFIVVRNLYEVVLYFRAAAGRANGSKKAVAVNILLYDTLSYPTLDFV